MSQHNQPKPTLSGPGSTALQQLERLYSASYSGRYLTPVITLLKCNV